MLAPAKVNLALRVLGKRPDGFHDLDTLFQEVSLTDRLEFYPSTDWSLEVVNSPIDSGADNLITRAATALSQAAGIASRAKIVLRKSIPVGGGLGGGSSNGAITLLGLNRLWRLRWTVERLHHIAAQIGSDCPFFLYGGSARGRGRGERLDLLEGSPAGEIVLVTPPFGISTKWAFESIRFPLTAHEKSAILQFCIKDGIRSISPAKIVHNDLENIVLETYPELGHLRDKLLRFGAEAAAVTGSGSTVFGIFGERARALHAAQQFGSPFETRICRMVSRRRVP